MCNEFSVFAINTKGPIRFVGISSMSALVNKLLLYDGVYFIDRINKISSLVHQQYATV